MAKPGRKHTLTRAILEAYMAVLGDGTPPFIKVAADRVGLSRKTLEDWLYTDQDLEANPLVAELRQRVAQVRGEYVARALAALTTASKETSEAARQTQWLLTRLDREQFGEEPRRQGRYPDKDRPAEPTTPRTEDATAPTVRAVADELAIPEQKH